MIDSTPSFARRDSQTDFSAQTQQQQAKPAGTRQQSKPSVPRIQSKPLKSSTSTSSDWNYATEFPDQSEDDDYIAERVRVAKESFKLIRDRINSLNDAGELDIDPLVSLFNLIKQAQKRGYIDDLRDYSGNTLTALSDLLATLLRRLAMDIGSEKFSLAGLNGADIHSLFNGFSAIVGEGPDESLLSRADLNKIRNSLSQSTEALLTYAHHEEIFQKQWDSSQLINSLNWLSRGLKQGLLSPKMSVIRQSFVQALKSMKSWVPADDDTTRPTTAIEPLDTRQLGKCMVQISTAMKFSLIDLEEHGSLLKEAVVGLCGANVLKEFTLWQQGSHSFERKLTKVSPEGTELTNISNTIKDCLRNKILDLGDSCVQLIINQLCDHLHALPDAALLERKGQRLGNSCNFLREVSEVALTTGPDLSCLGAYQKSCARMLNLIPRLTNNLSLDLLAEQSVVNLLSFVKAMDKTRQQSTTLLQTAAASLVSALPQMVYRFRKIDGVSGTLGALQHIAQRNMVPVEKVIDIMLTIFNKIDPEDLSRWPAISRVVLVRAAVYLWENLPMREAPSDTLRNLLQIMQVLLRMPAPTEDRLDYLKAVVLMMGQDAQWLEAHQSVIKNLMPEMTGDTISREDVIQTLKRLQSKELVIEGLLEPEPEPEPEANTLKSAAVIPAVAATVQSSPRLKEKPLVGMTRLVDTKAPAIVTNTAPTATAGTRTSITPLIQPSRSAQADGWQVPNRVVKVSKSEPVRADINTAAIKLQSTEPNLVARVEKKPVAASRSSVPASQKKPVKPVSTATPSKKASHQQRQQSQKLPPEQEWFQLLRREGRWSAHQQKRLEELLKAKPALAASSEGKGRTARSALFYAVSTGKTEAVRLIMGASSQQNLNAILIQVFDEALMVGDQERNALRACLSQLSRSQLDTLRNAMENKYSNSGISKKIASGYMAVLEEFGLDFKENKKQISNSPEINMKGNAIGQLSKPRVGREDWHDFKASSISPEVMMFFNSVPDHLEEIIEAAHYGNVDKVIALLKAESADENALGKDSMGCNLLLHAAAKGHADIVLELKKLKSIEDQAKAVNRLSGANALMAAASNDHPKVVKELLTLSSADSMARAIDHRRMNALMRAANRGSAAVIKLLAEMQSADDQATAIDAMGSNALRASAARGHLGVVDILINMRSGDEQALSTDNLGENALMHAAQHGQTEVVAKLLAMKSAPEQVKAMSSKNQNALDLALLNGHGKTAALLMEFFQGQLRSSYENLFRAKAEQADA